MITLHYFFSFLLLLSSIFVFISKNPVHSVLFLILTFCNAAGILFLFNAEFLGLVFIIIYDLLESFHLSDKSKFKNFEYTLKNSDNVYPPYNYQKFINNKCTYYKYLANKKIPVAPTHCISKDKWLNRESGKYVNIQFIFSE
jgi:hypothetical protein